MKPAYLYIVFVLLFINVYGQNDYSIKKIDSLKQKGLNVKVKDSSKLADTHFLIGETYRKYTAFTDSAYYHYYNAEKIYKKLNDKFQLALTLHGIAVIQKNEKDFTGSEVASFEAISLFETLEQTQDVKRFKSYTYNNLGILFKELEQYDKSIEYHKKALSLKKSLKGDNKNTIYISKNNLGNTYKEAKKYDQAIKWFNEVLENENLVNENPSLYVLTLGNYAHALYLSKKRKELPGLYLKALKISDSIQKNAYNSIIINQHLAEFYNNKKNKDSAKYYAYKAKEISLQYHNDDLLKSLLLLSEIEEGEKSSKHLKAYVKLNDSLQKNERAVRNNFARIRYETNKIEQENIQIAKERRWLFIISTVVIIASVLLYIVVFQRNKNRKLEFKQKQQEINEEIYHLMLSQNENIEEARNLEKKRISQELHDGVLGRLFGTRLNLDSLNMNTTDEAIKTRGQYIDELKTIENDIRKVSHELNTDFVSGSGFKAIIVNLIETEALTYEIKYKLIHDDGISWDSVNNKIKIHFYRVIQETLLNIHKHAQATEVEISFKLKNNVICLTISDNGEGFIVNKTKSGIGLKNINSRIEAIEGTFNITSKINVGTQIKIKVPITKT